MLHPCVACGTHLKAGTCYCPHCGAKICADRRTATALVLGLALAGCGDLKDGFAQPEYGVVVTDADGDGWPDGDDCDDDDEAVHPEAEEIPGDGIDQNCDGEDDT